MAKSAPAAPEQEGKTHRVCADIGERLHRRLKAHCAINGLRIGDVLRQLIEREWPTEAEKRGRRAA